MKIIEIELPFWQNPQFHIITAHQRDIVYAIFRCWDDDTKPELHHSGCVKFTDVIATQVHSKTKPYLPDDFEYRSSICEAIDSDWVSEHIKSIKEWSHEDLAKEDYHHYIVNSHDHQLSIICKNFTAHKTPPISEISFSLLGFDVE
ncbi:MULTISPECIES: hypothetical protein [Chromobacterium]|uniref:Uncharacterized protein n=1 Tax=Chromobacterium haemolyticum TaxID=394935 RepID=A0ABS3GVK3_9NEIS|nr:MULTISPECIES: hypothetical protein [Chromobacterium]MBK0417160.1 hypothetical protein [Chromobacterium haemolyticum]MBO0418298.1 hypothetical protein [Chromobacterium haemolyticum]MBO0501611.1 hypothetical protein [Chromobacterium haemolyticum]MDH0344183.1 hypothetical protein [Chromobacterium haemolyticum]